MENNNFHPIFWFLEGLMEACAQVDVARLDLKELNIQIHKPNIPKGEPYILVKRPFDDSFEELIFYLQTGKYRIIVADVDESYSPEEVFEDDWVKEELDELLNYLIQSQEIDAW